MPNEGKKGWTGGESFADVDWSKVSTAPLGPVEPGIYKAQTDDAEAEASQKNKAKIVHKLTLLARYGEGDLDTPRKVRDTIPVQRTTLFRVKSVAVALGIEPPKSSFPDDVDAFALDMKEAGARGFWVLIENELYEDLRSKTMKQGSRVVRYLLEEELEQAAAELKAAGDVQPQAAAAPPNGASAAAAPTPAPRRNRREASA